MMSENNVYVLKYKVENENGGYQMQTYIEGLEVFKKCDIEDLLIRYLELKRNVCYIDIGIYVATLESINAKDSIDKA